MSYPLKWYSGARRDARSGPAVFSGIAQKLHCALNVTNRGGRTAFGRSHVVVGVENASLLWTALRRFAG